MIKKIILITLFFCVSVSFVQAQTQATTPTPAPAPAPAQSPLIDGRKITSYDDYEKIKSTFENRTQKELNKFYGELFLNKNISESTRNGIMYNVRGIYKKQNENLQQYTKMSNLTLINMFENGRKSFLAIAELAKYICYIIGLFLIVSAINTFMKMSGDGRQDKGGLIQPLSIFFIGCSLFAFPSTVEIINSSLALGGPGDLLAPASTGGAVGVKALITSLSAFLYMIGVIAVIRGWLLLVDYANGKKDGTISRAMTHLGGGVCLMNFKATALILTNTFAPSATDAIKMLF